MCVLSVGGAGGMSKDFYLHTCLECGKDINGFLVFVQHWIENHEEELLDTLCLEQHKGVSHELQ